MPGFPGRSMRVGEGWLPLSFGIPFLGGLFLDAHSSLGVNSYRLLFAMAGVLIIISLVCVVAIDFDNTGNS